MIEEWTIEVVQNNARIIFDRPTEMQSDKWYTDSRDKTALAVSNDSVSRHCRSHPSSPQGALIWFESGNHGQPPSGESSESVAVCVCRLPTNCCHSACSAHCCSPREFTMHCPIRAPDKLKTSAQLYETSTPRRNQSSLYRFVALSISLWSIGLQNIL